MVKGKKLWEMILKVTHKEPCPGLYTLYRAIFGAGYKLFF